MNYDTRPTWTVTTFDPPVVVYHGHDLSEAIRIANFWDERQDTSFKANFVPIDDALSLAMWKFDRLRERYA